MVEQERWTSQQYQDYLKSEATAKDKAKKEQSQPQQPPIDKEEQREAKYQRRADQAEERKYRSDEYKKQKATETREEKYREEAKRVPKIFDTQKETDEYLSKLSPKERFEVEARLKGFKSGKERAEAIEYVNKETFQKADAAKARSLYGNPKNVYYETKEKILSGAKHYGERAKDIGSQVIGLKSREQLLAELKAGAKGAGAYVAGSAIIAMKGKKSGDIRTLEKVRTQLAQEKFREAMKEKAQKQHELAVAFAYSGRSPPKTAIRSRGRSLEQRMGGFGVAAGGFSLGGQSQRPIQRVVSRKSERQYVPATQPQGNPFGLSAKGLASPMGQRMVERPQRQVSRIQEKYPDARIVHSGVEVLGLGQFVAPRNPSIHVKTPRPINTQSNPFGLSAQGLINPVSSGNPIVSKKKKVTSNDPTGASRYF